MTAIGGSLCASALYLGLLRETDHCLADISATGKARATLYVPTPGERSCDEPLQNVCLCLQHPVGDRLRGTGILLIGVRSIRKLELCLRPALIRRSFRPPAAVRALPTQGPRL
jgi:hypothetical protein